MSEQAAFVGHEPCPECGSKDNLARYADGSAFCFGCRHHEKGNGESSTTSVATNKPSGLIDVRDLKAIPTRALTEETCRRWRYGYGQLRDGTRVQVAQYAPKGHIIAQKTRTKDKQFRFLGDTKKAGLFGMQLWAPGSAKKLVITEGEIDAMSVSQVQNHRWPVVSVENGADGAADSIRRNFDYVNSFDEVILMFDQDEAKYRKDGSGPFYPGQDAAKECAALLPPGKVKIARLPMKDPSEMLVAGLGKEIVNAIWTAEPYRPDGLVSIDDIIEDIRKPVEWGLPWFLPTLTQLTYGRRWGEAYAIGAGTGIGKTDFMTQQMAADVRDGRKVGVLYLEQKPSETGKRLAGKLTGKRFHIPDAGWTEEELEEGIRQMGGQVQFYDNFGQTDWDVVKGHIRYMAVGMGIRLFYLDHLTALADTSNEKESLEKIMQEMAGLAMELQIIIHFVSHLSTPKDGKPHEEGGRVTIANFKGSRTIGFWSHYMFGLERDQQAEDPRWRSVTTFRVLKDRYTGQATGEVIYLGYDPDTGLLFETEQPDAGDDFPDDDDDVPF